MAILPGPTKTPTTTISSEEKWLHYEVVAPEKQASFRRAINTKNPLALQTFEERGASIAAKIDRIQQNEKYKKLSPQEQAKVRGDMYEKYVKPSYAGFHLEAPSKENWVELTSKEDKIGNRTGANSFYDSKGQQFGMSTLMGIDSALTGIGLFGLKISNKAFQQLHGIDSSFSAHLPESFQKAVEQTDSSVQKHIQRTINSEQRNLQNQDVWLKSHYRDSRLNSLGKLSGEFIATLPLYNAIASQLAGAGAVAGLEAEAAGPLLNRAGTLGTKLVRTPMGKYVYGTLKAATDGYLGTLVASGGSSKDAIAGGIGGGVLHGVAAPILSKVAPLAGKVASFPLIKKWTASLLSMAGKPFAQDLAASAMHEESAAVHYAEEHATNLNPHEMNMGMGITIKHSTDTKGYINFEGVDHPYTTREEQQTLFTNIERLAEKKRALKDPLLADLHTAEKESQRSIAMQLYGKGTENLSRAQRARVLATRIRLIDEAVEEAPVHLPEQAKAEVESSLEKQAKENPERDSWLKKIQSDFKESIPEVIAKENGKKVAVETGIINPKAVIDKLNSPVSRSASRAAARREAAGLPPLSNSGARYKTNAEYDYEPPDGSSASLDDFRKNSVSYLRKGESEGRRASDGTLVGKRDKRAWNEILKSNNRTEFVELLKEADGDRIHFENDLHRMLFHYSSRDELPAPMRDKLLREIKKAALSQKNIGQQWSAGEARAAADNVVLHAYELGKGGRLQAGEPFFNSTNVNPNWSPTTWQMELHNENDDLEYAKIEEALKRHPKQLKTLMTTVKTLAEMKYKAPTLDRYLELDSIIRSAANSALTRTIGIGEKGGK